MVADSVVVWYGGIAPLAYPPPIRQPGVALHQRESGKGVGGNGVGGVGDCGLFDNLRIVHVKA